MPATPRLVRFALLCPVEKSCQAEFSEVKSPQIADVIGQKLLSNNFFCKSKSACYKGPAEEETARGYCSDCFLELVTRRGLGPSWLESIRWKLKRRDK